VSWSRRNYIGVCWHGLKKLIALLPKRLAVTKVDNSAGMIIK
jgi:hypothetical protein